MNFHVTNKAMSVGEIRLLGVSSSSVFLIGDTQQIICSSIFDSPPESVTTGPLVPLPPEKKKENNK